MSENDPGATRQLERGTAGYHPHILAGTFVVIALIAGG
jgi:hypothetical protein